MMFKRDAEIRGPRNTKSKDIEKGTQGKEIFWIYGNISRRAVLKMLFDCVSVDIKTPRPV